jgi:hypothetical protein
MIRTFYILKNMKIASLFLAVALSATLAACGGGGGGGSAAAPATVTTPPTVALTDKYTGTWSNCSSTGVQTTVVVTKSSDTFYGASFEFNLFSGYPCTGASTAAPNGTGTMSFQIVGTKTELGTNKIVDKFIDLSDGTKDLIHIDPNVTLSNGSTVALLYFGDEFSALDVDGFPQSLDTINPLQKQ